MLKTFLAIVFISISSLLQAQTKTLDSIRQQIKNHPQPDTVRIGLLMDYVKAAINENTSQLLPILTEMISTSKALKYNKGLQWGYSSAQLYYADRGDFANGMAYADSSLAMLKLDTSTYAKVSVAFLYNNMAGDYLKMGDFEQAIRYYTMSAEILEQHKPAVVATIYSGLAEVYEKLKQPDKALAYDERAIAAAEKSGNKSSIAKRYVNYAGRFVNQKQFEKAEEVLNKIQRQITELDESFLYVFYYQNRGYIAQSGKNFEKAISDFKKAYSYALANDDKYQQLSTLDPLAACLLEAGKQEEAKAVLDSLLAQSIRFNMRFSRVNAYNSLAKWHIKNGDYKSATEYLNKKIALSDSISSDEIRERVAMLETSFKVKQKDNEIKILQGEKEVQRLSLYEKSLFNNISLGSIAALILISLLSYRNYRHRQKLQTQRITELETEKQLAATEAVLKGEDQERTRMAKDLHDGLGGMLSGIKYSLHSMKGNLIMTPENAQAFERSIDMLDSSIAEMRRVAHNMMPENLVKFGLDTALKDFCNDIQQSGALSLSYQSFGMAEAVIDQTKSITIYRIVQELVNNVIRHASATQALVQLTYHASQLSVTVEDDGRGFDKGLLGTSKGMGWNNIINRIELLKGKWDIDVQPGEGTSVNITIDN